jgi:hypothetical protein
MHDRRLIALGIGTEKNGGPEYPLERFYQPAILGAALLHSENVEHFCCAAKRNGLFLLPHGKCRKKNGHQPILPPRNAVLGMAGDLQKKLAVPALVYECTFGGTLNR